MAAIKYDTVFATMRRRGLENVRAEMLEKIIAYNVDRFLMLRTRKTKQEQSRQKPA